MYIVVVVLLKDTILEGDLNSRIHDEFTIFWMVNNDTQVYMWFLMLSRLVYSILSFFIHSITRFHKRKTKLFFSFLKRDGVQSCALLPCLVLRNQNHECHIHPRRTMPSSSHSSWTICCPLAPRTCQDFCEIFLDGNPEEKFSSLKLCQVLRPFLSHAALRNGTWEQV